MFFLKHYTALQLSGQKDWGGIRVLNPGKGKLLVSSTHTNTLDTNDQN